MRAAIYLRISDDKVGKELGVTRQREDCEKLARSRGLTVAPSHVYVDNSRSAFSGKPRPDYLRLLETIRRGEVHWVVSWDPDRLHRSPRELEDFIDLMETTGVQVATVKAGDWDLSTAAGRQQARSLGTWARYESEHKSERVRRALEQNAQDGRPHGRVKYGWRRERDEETGEVAEVLHPEQAAVVQRIARQILAGDSLARITAELEAEGVPTANGGPWRRNSVRELALRERNAGRIVHRGQVVGDGAFPAILEPAVFDQVKAVLRAPERKTVMSKQSVTLLASIALCGECGAKLRGSVNGRKPSYRCEEKGCVSRQRADVDAVVEGAILGRLARPDASALLAPAPNDDQTRALEEVRELRARLDGAADDYADGKIDRRMMERISARLTPQLDAAEARTLVVDDSPLLDGLAGNDRAAEVWATLPLERKRAVVQVLAEVRVRRGVRGTHTFDPSLVHVNWK